MRAIAVLLLLPAALAAADEPGLVLRGSWIAAAGPKQVLRGRWSARVEASAPDAAVGSWTLDNENGDTVMEGTWSARKAARAWRGTWSARVQVDRTAAGEPVYGGAMKGTWEADTAGLGGKTFEDLLKQTAERQLSGTWRYGRMRGNWWLAR